VDDEKEVGMTHNMGTLYGIGVGPGDPDLLTVKAVRVLQTVDTVFTAASTKNNYSLAVNIVRAHIPDHVAIQTLSFPMTQDEKNKQAAWNSHANTILETLKQGKTTAFLTLGDPMTYSTFGYLVKSIQAIAPEAPIVTIPGITSYQAAAARLNTPLVEGEESLLVVSGSKGGDHFRRLSAKPDSVVFLKAYRHVADICAALRESDMIEKSTGIVNCTLPEEEIIREVGLLNERKPGYWTLIISKKK
jgi:precorrin-2/cobalt-factor-2 C20-methyltransferase